MKDIQLFEYEPEPIVDDVLEIIKKHLDTKNKVNNKFFKLIVQNNKLALKARQFVGVAQFDDVRISVYPKIYYNNGNEGKKVDVKSEEAMANFIYMLAYVLNLGNIKHFDSSSHITKNVDFLEVLINLFARELMELLKRNLNRAYVVVEDESSFLKGTWRLSEQLSRAPHLKHKFYVCYDEFTADNPLNRILKFVCEMLIRYSRNTRNITLLKNIRLIFAEVDNISKPTEAIINQVKFSRLNKEFEFVFQLAKMFIQRITGDYSKTGNRNFTFMFDMNMLFEQFIAEFIRREGLTPNGCDIKTQVSSKYLCYKVNGVGDLGSGAGLNSANISIKENNGAFILKPDIIFKKKKIDKEENILINKEENILIIDTKYKLLEDKDEKKFGVSSADAHQMYAYAKKYKCERVILLYPKHKDVVEQDYFFDKESNKKLEIRTINLCRDLKEEKGKLKEELEKIIKNENNSLI